MMTDATIKWLMKQAATVQLETLAKSMLQLKVEQENNKAQEEITRMLCRRHDIEGRWLMRYFVRSCSSKPRPAEKSPSWMKPMGYDQFIHNHQLKEDL